MPFPDTAFGYSAFRHSAFRPVLFLVGTLLSAFALGCSSSSVQDEVDIARYHLPRVRTVPHPDSLVHMTVDWKRTPPIAVDTSAAVIQRRWSAGPTNVQGGQFLTPGGYSSFATLRSKEYVLTVLDRSLGLLSLSPDVSRPRLKEALEDGYDPHIAFDVYLFIDSRYREARRFSALKALRPSVTLEDQDGNTYDATRISRPPTPADRSVVEPGPTAFFNVSTVYFDRVVDGHDRLADVETLTLTIRAKQPRFIQVAYTWSFSSAADAPAQANAKAP